jgi:hypothetical protein
VYVKALGNGPWLTLPKILANKSGNEVDLKPGTILEFHALAVRQHMLGGDGVWAHLPPERCTVKYELRKDGPGIVIPPGSIETGFGEQIQSETFVPLQFVGECYARVLKVPRQ